MRTKGAAGSIPRRLISSYRVNGIRAASGRISDRLLDLIVGRILRSTKHPTMGDLARAAGTLDRSATSLIEGILPGSASRLSELEQEVNPLLQEMAGREASRELPFSPRISIEEESSKALYYLTRLTKPRLMLETGVANGRSTFFLLQALRANNVGQLVSVDVDERVGALIDPEESERWTKIILRRENLPRRLKESLGEIRNIDIFFHDSDHHYRWMNHEFRSVEPLLSSTGYIVSDDVELNQVFLESSNRLGARPHFLLDTKKVLGIMAKGESGESSTPTA